jgi:hypothetical protein
VPIGLAALVVGILTLQGGEPSASSPVASTSTVPKLRAVDLAVANDREFESRQAVDLMVRNAGFASAAVSEALIEIREVKHLPLCYTQGDLPVSERYGTELPVNADSGEVTEVPLHQQIAAGGVDRFRIELSPQGEVPGEHPGMDIFEISVALRHDGIAEPLEMGTALISLPSPPFATLYYLTEGELAELNSVYNVSDPRQGWADVMPCWQENGRAMLELRESPAARSAELDEVLSTAVVPSYSEG